MLLKNEKCILWITLRRPWCSSKAVCRDRRFVPNFCIQVLKNRMFLSCSLLNIHYCRCEEVACSTSDNQGSDPVSGGQCHLIYLIHPQEVLLVQFSLHVHNIAIHSSILMSTFCMFDIMYIENKCRPIYLNIKYIG